jgi:hypothetical protein
MEEQRILGKGGDIAHCVRMPARGHSWTLADYGASGCQADIKEKSLSLAKAG